MICEPYLPSGGMICHTQNDFFISAFIFVIIGLSFIAFWFLGFNHD